MSKKDLRETRICEYCLWFRPQPAKRQIGVCFKKENPCGYGKTENKNEACKFFTRRMLQRHFSEGQCNACSRRVDKTDRFCRHCGMEFVQ